MYCIPYPKTRCFRFIDRNYSLTLRYSSIQHVSKRCLPSIAVLIVINACIALFKVHDTVARFLQDFPENRRKNNGPNHNKQALLWFSVEEVLKAKCVSEFQAIFRPQRIYSPLPLTPRDFGGKFGRLATRQQKKFKHFYHDKHAYIAYLWQEM